MGTLQTSFYTIEGVETDEDCDHGHCVGLTVNHGDGPSMVWLFVESAEAAERVKATLDEVTELQMVNYR